MKLMIEIRALTCRQLIYYLTEEVNGGELLMKEVWEECETEDHVEAVKWELTETISFLRERLQLLGVDDAVVLMTQ